MAHYIVLRSGAPLRFNYTVCGAQAQLNEPTMCLMPAYLCPKIYITIRFLCIKVGLGRTFDDDTTQIITTVESHSVQWYKISLVSSAKKIRIFFGGSPYCDSVSVDLLNFQYVFYHVFNSALCPLFFQNLVYTWRRTFFWQFLAEK